MYYRYSIPEKCYSDQASGHVQPGFGPEPEIIKILGLYAGPIGLQPPPKQMVDLFLHILGGIWKPVEPP